MTTSIGAIFQSLLMLPAQPGQKPKERKDDVLSPGEVKDPLMPQGVGQACFSVPGVLKKQPAPSDITLKQQLEASAFVALLRKEKILPSSPLDMKTPAVATLLEIARHAGGVEGNIFTSGLPKLISLGIIQSKADLDARTPDSIGATLVQIVKLAGEHAWGVFSLALPHLTDGNDPILSKQELRRSFHTISGNWLGSLALIARDGGEHSWVIFQYGFPLLIRSKLIRKEHLDEDLTYRASTLSCQMTHISFTIQGGWDFFESILPDILAALQDPNSKVVAKLLQEIAEPTKRFYESGRDMRWKSKISPFSRLLPFEDPVALLHAIAILKKNPQSPALIDLLEKKWNVHILAPRSMRDIEYLERYAELLLVLTQRGVDKDTFLRRIDLRALTHHFREKNASEIVQIAEILNILLPEASERELGLGDRWLRSSQFSVKGWKESEVEVNLDNLDEIYARLYILQRSQGDTFQQKHFVWKNGVNRKLTIADVGRIILASHRLKFLFGDAHPLRDFFSGIRMNDLQLEMKNIPPRFFSVKGLEQMRREMNTYTDNVGGDQYVALISQILTTASIESIGIDSLIKAMLGWSRIEEIKGDDLSHDIEGRYLLFAKHAATRVRDYFERHSDELASRYDRVEIKNALQGFKLPLRQAPVVELSPRQKERKKKEPVTPSPWPKTRGIPREGEASPSPEASVLPQDPLLLWLERAEKEGVSLSDPMLKNVRLEEPKTVEPLRMKIASKTDQKKADSLVHLIYESFFRNPISTKNVDIFFVIAQGLFRANEPYKVWGHYAAGKLRDFLKELSPEEKQTIEGVDDMMRWLKGHGIVSETPSDFAKGVERLQNGEVGYVLRKVWGRLNQRSDIKEAMKGEIMLEEISGALHGFEIQRIVIEGKHQATLIVGDPKKGARIGVKIQPGSGISSQVIKKEIGSRLQYQGPVLMVSGNNKGIELMVERGKNRNFVFDSRRLDGYLIIYPDGSMHIADKHQLRLSELTRKKDDRNVMLDLTEAAGFRRFFKVVQEENLSLLASLLFKREPGNEAYTANNAPSTVRTPDSRRFLVEFADGRFGLVDGEGTDHTLNDLLSIIWRIKGVVRALYCDTGMYDRATYYRYIHGERKEVMVGHSDIDKASNRVYFFSGEARRRQ